MKQIPLSRGLFAIVDDEDYERVSQFKWCACPKDNGRFYAYNSGKAGGDGRAKTRKRIYLHQFILGIKWVDHKNGDTLDCRKENLRSATAHQNGCNKVRKKTSRALFKGIYQKKNGSWRASCGPNGPDRRHKVCPTALEAAFSYDRMAREMYGEFARTNFPDAQFWHAPKEQS